jgi:hypothetical protein
VKLRVALIAAWLIVGQVVAGALYWVLLSTPESNATMLVASAALVVLIAFVAGVTLGAAILTSASAGVGRAVIGAPWLVVALVPALVIWWIVLRADAWMAAHSGEIAAWFIATLGWADVSWLMRGLGYISVWLRWVVGPLLTIALFAALLFRERAALRRPSWIRRALRPATLIVSTLAFLLFVALPVQAVYWRPPGLPATWVEPTAAVLRLGLIALAVTIGWAIMIAMVADRRPAEPPPTIGPPVSSNPSEVGEMSLE